MSNCPLIGRPPQDQNYQNLAVADKSTFCKISGQQVNSGSVNTVELVANTIIADSIIANSITSPAETHSKIPLAVGSGNVNFGTGGLFFDSTIQFTTAGNSTYIFSVPAPLQSLVFVTSTANGVDIGTLTLEVYEVDKTTLIPGTSTSLVLGTAVPAYGNITYTFTTPIAANTPFSVKVVGSVSGTAQYAAQLYGVETLL